MEGILVMKLFNFAVAFMLIVTIKRDLNESPGSDIDIVFSDESDSCITPSGLNGFCVVLADCQSMYTRLKSGTNTRAFLEFVRRSTCGYEGNTPVVCCPDIRSQTPPTPGLTKSPKKVSLLPVVCGEINPSRIVGGQIARKGSRPWLALLGGYSRLKGRLDFHCTGSLITNRHILTAAHCDDWRVNLTTVRLGEHDLHDSSELVHKDFLIKDIRKHEAYGRYMAENDIAIITLERPVKFKGHIGPICLPSGNFSNNNSFEGIQALVAGWGATDNKLKTRSTVLQEAIITIQSLDVCKKSYASRRIVISDNQLCAFEEGKDSCQGDSGGPLMVVDTVKGRYATIGIVSFGLNCSDPDFPGVYTKVSSYMDWIENNLQP